LIFDPIVESVIGHMPKATMEETTKKKGPAYDVVAVERNRLGFKEDDWKLGGAP
jgi:hypothetical protein